MNRHKTGLLCLAALLGFSSLRASPLPKISPSEKVPDSIDGSMIDAPRHFQVFEGRSAFQRFAKTPRVAGAAPVPTLAESFRRPKHVLPLALATGVAILGVGFADHRLNRAIKRSSHEGLGRVIDRNDYGRSGTLMELLGEPHVTIGIAGLIYAGGMLGDSERAKRTGVVATEATVASGVMVLAIKTVVGRKRPVGPEDADEFKPFRGTKYDHMSFPSGHTTTAFTLAAVIAEAYPAWPVQTLVYGAASAVGFGRIYQSQHWTSDVLGGAALGIVAAKWVSRWESKKGWCRKLYSDGRGLYFRQEF